MCRAVTCKKCKKASWAGCGAHVEQVLAGVPKADRCACRETAPVGNRSGGFGQSIRRLFGLD
jgi:hypothetical protein